MHFTQRISLRTKASKWWKPLTNNVKRKTGFMVERQAEIREERWNELNPTQVARRALGIDDIKWEGYVTREEAEAYPTTATSIKAFAPNGMVKPENETEPEKHKILTAMVRKELQDVARRKVLEETKYGIKYPDNEDNPLTFTTRHGLMKAHLALKAQLPGIPRVNLPDEDTASMDMYNMYFRSKE